jgi:hypothetical protein
MISYLFSNLIPQYPEIEFGAHLHTTPDKWFEKIDAAYHAVVAVMMVPFRVWRMSYGQR